MREVRARASSALLFKLANSLLTPADFQVCPHWHPPARRDRNVADASAEDPRHLLWSVSSGYLCYPYGIGTHWLMQG